MFAVNFWGKLNYFVSHTVRIQFSDVMVTVSQDSSFNECTESCDDNSSKPRENLKKCVRIDRSYRDVANNKLERDFADTLYIQTDA